MTKYKEQVESLNRRAQELRTVAQIHRDNAAKLYAESATIRARAIGEQTIAHEQDAEAAVWEAASVNLEKQP